MSDSRTVTNAARDVRPAVLYRRQAGTRLVRLQFLSAERTVTHERVTGSCLIPDIADLAPCTHLVH